MADLDLIFAGDLVLDEPDPDHWLAGIAPALQSADIAIGHLEVPHTRSRNELRGDVPAPGADPEHLSALARAGFSAVSLAGNHIADCGPAGIEDTVRELDALGIAHSGAGQTLDAARAPAVIRHEDHRVALLSYNCVGPENSWARAEGAGCAYVRIETTDGAPISPSAELDRFDASSLMSMSNDIARAAQDFDLIIVALHKGIVHTPARLAQYEVPVAHAAIDAGADIVLGHHAHIVRGIELYRGKPIFHGLGNGCVVTRALSPDQSHPARASWARRRKALFGFEPDPAYHLAPFHPDAVNAMLGCVRWSGGALQIGFVPVHVDPPGRPRAVAGATAQRIVRYIDRITVAAGLPPLNIDLHEDRAWLRIEHG